MPIKKHVVSISVAKNDTEIHPARYTAKTLPYSEEELLKGLNPENAHAEELASSDASILIE